MPRGPKGEKRPAGTPTAELEDKNPAAVALGRSETPRNGIKKVFEGETWGMQMWSASWSSSGRDVEPDERDERDERSAARELHWRDIEEALTEIQNFAAEKLHGEDRSVPLIGVIGRWVEPRIADAIPFHRATSRSTPLRLRWSDR